MARGSGTQGAGAEHAVPVNEVVLVGRVSGVPESRELPSGDVVTTFRVVVDRPVVRGRPPRQAQDVLDCVAWTAALRRRSTSLVAGDQVAVEGALRRRFWRGSAGTQSRCEVEVRALARLERAAS